MKSELFNNRLMKHLESTDQKPTDGLLYGMELDEVYKMYPDQANQISFIPVSIKRAKHAAVPIVTPSGDHCILASDALLEILRRLISALKIFQKIELGVWDELGAFLQSIEPFFSSSQKSFLKTEEFDKIKAETDECWLEFRKKAMKKSNNKKKKGPRMCREVGKFGFDIEFLKEELKELELLDAFPDIMQHVESVFSKIFKSRQTQYLRSSDLCDAVEQCQLISLVNRFPKLKSFLHQQKGCHQLFQCDLCSAPSETAKFKNTQWKEYTESDVQIKYPTEGRYRIEIDWLMDIPGDISTVSNLSLMTDEEIQKFNPKYFILDSKDIKWAAGAKKESLLSLSSFMKSVPKKIYVRTIPVNAVLCVFTDDILEIIPILLKQQNRGPSNELLSQYEKKWKIEGEKLHGVIELELFEKILEQFDIDKTKITIIPDAVQKVTLKSMSDRFLNTYETTFSSNGKRVMRSQSAMLYIFESLVCGIKWTMDCCKKHPNCKEDLKSKVIGLLEEYFPFSSLNCLMPCDRVDQCIKTLQEHCTYKLQKKLNLPDVGSPWDQIAFLQPPYAVQLAYYVKLFDAYGLQKLLNPLDYKEHDIVLWAFRTACVRGWCDAFFEEESALNLEIRNAAVDRIPSKHIEENSNIIEIALGLEAWDTEKLPAEKEESKTELLAVQHMESSETGSIQVPINQSSAPKLITSSENPAPALPAMSLPPPSDLPCRKCNESREEVIENYRKVMNLEKSLKEKDAELEKLRDLEIKAKKADEMETKLKELEKESEELKKKHLKILEENHKMMKDHGSTKELKDRLKEKESALKVLEDSIDSMKTEIQDLQSARSALLQDAFDKDEKIEELTAIHKKSMEDKDKDMEKQRQHYSKLMAEKEELQVQMNAKNEELWNMKKSMEELEMTNDKSKKSYDTLKKDHTKSVDQLKKSHSEAMKLKSSEFEKKLQAKISEKDAEVLKEKRINKELTESNRVLQQKVSDLAEKSEADHWEMILKQSHLENELTQKNQIISDLQEADAKQISEESKAREELQVTVSAMRGLLDKISPAPLSPEAQQALLSLQKHRDTLTKNSPLKLANYSIFSD